MTEQSIEALVERLEDEALALSRAAWSRPDGGQDCAIASGLVWSFRVLLPTSATSGCSSRRMPT